MEHVSSASHESVHVFPFFLRHTAVSGGLCWVRDRWTNYWLPAPLRPMELLSSERAAIVSLNEKEISHLAPNDDSQERTGTEKKYTLFCHMKLTGNEIFKRITEIKRHKAEMDRGHCSWVAPGDPAMTDGELCPQCPAAFQHGNERASLPPLPQPSWDTDPEPFRGAELLGFAHPSMSVHALCHQNAFVSILTKRPQRMSPILTNQWCTHSYLLFISAKNIWFHFARLLVSRVNDTWSYGPEQRVTGPTCRTINLGGKREKLKKRILKYSPLHTKCQILGLTSRQMLLTSGKMLSVGFLFPFYI